MISPITRASNSNQHPAGVPEPRGKSFTSNLFFAYVLYSAVDGAYFYGKHNYDKMKYDKKSQENPVIRVTRGALYGAFVGAMSVPFGIVYTALDSLGFRD